MKISTRQLRSNLGEYLRMAQEGTEVHIMRYGKEVARLTACEEEKEKIEVLHFV